MPPWEYDAWSGEVCGALFTGSNVVAGPGLHYGPGIAALFTQPDGKIVVAGVIDSCMDSNPRLMLRLNADGGIDPTFNPPFIFDGVIRAATLVENGKIVVGGWYESTNDTVTGVFRLNSDGSLDSGFEAGNPFAGSVSTLTVLPDGKLLVGYTGYFSGDDSVGGLVRLFTNGEMDPTFSAAAGVQPQFSIIRQPDGKLLIDGLTRLEADGSLDPTFQPTPPTNFVATAAMLQPDGRIVLAGAMAAAWDYPFQSISPAVLRLNTDGSLDTSFRMDSRVGLARDVQVCGETISPRCLALQMNGQILVGGVFTHFNGEHRPSVVRLNADGSLDPTLMLHISENIGCDVGTVDGVSAMLIVNDGRVLVAGRFSQISGISRTMIARLHLGASACPSVVSLERGEFVVSETESALEIVVKRGGDLSRATSVAWHTADPEYFSAPARPGIDFWPTNGVVEFAPGENARSIHINISDNRQVQANRALFVKLDPVPGEAVLSTPTETRVVIVDDEALGLPGSNAESFQWPFRDGTVGAAAFALEGDGRIVVATAEPLPHRSYFRIVRLESDGTLESILTPPITGECHTVTIDPADGRIIIAGAFLSVAGPHTNIVRFNANGSVDTTFNAQVGTEYTRIFAVLRLPSRELLVGGSFSIVNGESRSSLVRLHADGTLDDTFNPGPIFWSLSSSAAGTIKSLARQADGKLIIGGEFMRIDTVLTTNVARLNPDGSVDASFSPPVFHWYNSSELIVQPDQKILVGPGISRSSGNHWSAVIRLNPDGSLDDDLSTNVPPIIGNSMALQSNGKIIVDGLRRLLPDGTTDGSYLADGSPYSYYGVRKIMLEPGGDLLVAGDFTRWNNLPVMGMVRLRAGEDLSAGRIDFAQVELNATEGDGAILVPVRRSGGTVGSVSVTVQTRDDSALAGQDYTAVSKTITFGVGQAAVQYVSVPLLNDAIARRDRKFIIVITNVTGGGLLGPNDKCDVSITDDETGVGFSSAEIVEMEHAYSVYFDIRCSGPTNNAVSVYLETSGGTAVPGVDYVPLSMIITFPPGVQRVLKTISPINNLMPGPDKTIGLVLSNPSGAQLTRSTMTIQLLDDDRPTCIAQAGFTPAGRFCLTLDVQPYRSGLLQTSTNLLNWIDISWYYRELRHLPVVIEDTAAPQTPQRFYRLKQTDY